MSIEQEQLLKELLAEQKVTNDLLRERTEVLSRHVRDIAMILYEAHPTVDPKAVAQKLLTPAMV